MAAEAVAGVVAGDRVADADQRQTRVNVTDVHVAQDPSVAVPVVACARRQGHRLPVDQTAQRGRRLGEAALATLGGVDADDADPFGQAGGGAHVDRVAVDDARDRPGVGGRGVARVDGRACGLRVVGVGSVLVGSRAGGGGRVAERLRELLVVGAQLVVFGTERVELGLQLG
jgi:hypothetical protein